MVQHLHCLLSFYANTIPLILLVSQPSKLLKVELLLIHAKAFLFLYLYFTGFYKLLGPQANDALY
uniref:Uncharacterized protein n=1 Tax=Manihot esculenta TaxID=3983 RepID=A0A2C9UBS9_MANES